MSKSKKDPFNKVGNFIRAAPKNIERGFAADFANLGQLFKGNFNNQFNSAMQGSATQSVFGNDTKKAAGWVGAGGDTAVERLKTEADNKAADDVIKDAQNQQAAQGQMIANTIMGLSEAKKRTPGRKQVMGDNLLKTMQSNSLLSMANKA